VPKIFIPAGVNPDALPLQKLVNLQVFCRRGGTRFQDHATRGNADTKHYKEHKKKIELSKRKVFRACGRVK
jgi:hypothetical protein